MDPVDEATRLAQLAPSCISAATVTSAKELKR